MKLLSDLKTWSAAQFVAGAILVLALILGGILATSSSTANWPYNLFMAALPVAAYLTYALFRPFPNVAADDSATQVYRFENCVLDPVGREIRFEGRPVEMQPRVFDLVEYLVRERGRAVGKDELFEKVWPSVVVTEGSLTQSVKRARSIFRDNGISVELIKTVHSHGYRFDAEVEKVAGDGQATSVGTNISMAERLHWRPLVWSMIFGVGLAALGLWRAESVPALEQSIDANSIVVLPFENLTADESFDWFPDGMTETLSQALAGVNGLKIIGRASASKFRGTNTPHSEIGVQLNVANVVEGSVQRSAEMLRITARLVSTVDGSVLWSQTYNREFGDIFEIQDDIARSCVEQLETAFASQLANVHRRQQDPRAYEFFLKAVHQRGLRNADSLARASALFESALQIDPLYKEALLGLANTKFQRATMGSIPRELSFNEAVALIRQALSIDSEYSEAYVQLAEIQHRHYWQFEQARKTFEKAMALHPGNAEAHSAYGRFLSKIGEFEDAVLEATIARDLDPLSAGANASLAIRLIRVNALPAAREVLDQMHEQFPENGDLPWLESLWNLRNQSYAEVLSRIADEEYEYLRLSISAIAYHHLGRTEQARTALDRLIAIDADGATFQIAEVFAQWRQPDSAFDWLDRAFAKGDPGLAELLSSASFEPIYDDPRFGALLAKVGLPTLK